MKQFEMPEFELVRLDAADVIVTSLVQPGFEGYAPDSDDSEFGG